MTSNISGQAAGSPKEKQLRDYPARLIEEEAASGEHARGRYAVRRGEGGRRREGREKACRRPREAGLGKSQDQVAGRCSPWLNLPGACTYVLGVVCSVGRSLDHDGGSNAGNETVSR